MLHAPFCGVLQHKCFAWAIGTRNASDNSGRIKNIEEYDMGDKKCSGEHKKHLCSLAGKKKIDENEELVKDPQFICRKCGRVADVDKSVCKPKALER